MVEVLRYKPESSGSIPDPVTVILQALKLSSRSRTLGSTQPLTEMSTRNISFGVKAEDA
jgi:hypothetical protein